MYIGTANATSQVPQITSRTADAASTDARSQRRLDMKLVAGIVEGDDDSFEHLYKLYHERIFRFAVKRLGDASEAEDVVQDVFLEIFRCAGSYQGRSSLLTWMFGIAHNQVCRRFRRKSAPMVSIDDSDAIELESHGPSPDRQVEAARVLRRVVEVAGEPVEDWHGFASRYQAHAGGSVPLVVQAVGEEEVEEPAPREVAVPALGDVARLGVIPAVLIANVFDDRPAARAGFQRGDLILSVDGEPVASFEAFAETVRTSEGRALALTYARDGAVAETSVAPELTEYPNTMGATEVSATAPSRA